MRPGISTLCLAGCAALCGGEALAADTPSGKLADTMEQRLAACAECHGKQGEGKGQNEYYPRIGGKPARYLYNQLINFRDGRRSYPQMSYLVRYLTDDYLREIAEYYAGLRPQFLTPIKPSASKEALARGAVLVNKGDAANNVPACAACHGKALTGMQPAIPGLLGLHPDYVAAQLGAWQKKARAADAPDCMAQIAARLSGTDIAALAKWLAAQPGSPATLPAPEDPKKLPIACGSQSAPAASAVAQPAKASDVQRGEYLARAGDCVACHTARGGEPFTGGLLMATPFGALYTPNITPDRETGIGQWSADDFWRALHEGRSRDGSLLYPAFPYPNYTKVTRADADAIFAYLKSIKPVHKRNRPHEMGFPYNQRKLLLGWRALYFDPAEYVPRPGESAEWNRGAYLVQGLGHCDACHTGRNILGATRKGDAFAGGVMPVQEWYAPSLTSNREAGIGQWDIADVVALLQTGVAKRGAVYGPMAQVVHDSLQYLTDSDVRAMAVYLKSLVPQGAAADPVQIRPTEQQSKALYEQGAKLYDRHCADCHQANGTGLPPAYPPLANNQSIAMEFAANPIRMVMFGGYPPGTKGNPRPYGMPPFAQALSDRDVAAVVTYIRQSWGNRAAAVSSADVARFRAVPLE